MQSVFLEDSSATAKIAGMLPTKLLIDETQLTAFCQKYGVARLSLFGSMLRNDFDASRSDIDVLVEFLPSATKCLFTLIEMEHTLARFIGRPVDLNTPGSLSKYFRDRVLSEAEVLYDVS